MGAMVYVRCDGPDLAEIRLARGRIILHPGQEIRVSLGKDANFKLNHLDTVIDHGMGDGKPPARHVEE